MQELGGDVSDLDYFLDDHGRGMRFTVDSAFLSLRNADSTSDADSVSQWLRDTIAAVRRDRRAAVRRYGEAAVADYLALFDARLRRMENIREHILFFSAQRQQHLIDRVQVRPPRRKRKKRKKAAPADS